MLQNLMELKSAAKVRIAKASNLQIQVTDGLKAKIIEAYRSISSETVTEFSWGLRVTSLKGNVAYLPFEWFSIIQCCSDYIFALNTYADKVDDFENSATGDDCKLVESILSKLPAINWRDRLEESERSYVENYLTSEFSVEVERKNFDDFLDGRTWLDIKSEVKGTLQGKKLNRETIDYIASAVSKIGLLLDVMCGRLDKFIEIYLKDRDLVSLVVNAQLVGIDNSDISLVSNLGAENKIYYGAPGTGKSFEIDAIVKNKQHISTVFHPDTQYSDFVGCLKPSMNGADIVYKFREGPFCKALKLAHENPTENCYLVIEEINRASAAAVFGEIFQLLDRDLNGRSIYGIDVNDPDMLSYLLDNSPTSILKEQLQLPSNLSIYATMNSSDQAVMPMDTAFKRRWKFKYKSVDFQKCANGQLKVFGKGSELIIDWKDFAESVNSILVSQDVPEDRLLGPWFLKEDELKDEEAALQAITGKLFMYLWDDVLRHGLRTTIFNDDVKNYGQLVARFIRKEPVFNVKLFSCFEDVTKSVKSPSEHKYAIQDNSIQHEGLEEALVAESKPVGYITSNDVEAS